MADSKSTLLPGTIPYLTEQDWSNEYALCLEAKQRVHSSWSENRRLMW